MDVSKETLEIVALTLTVINAGCECLLRSSRKTKAAKPTQLRPRLPCRTTRRPSLQPSKSRPCSWNALAAINPSGRPAWFPWTRLGISSAPTAASPFAFPDAPRSKR